MARLHLVMKTEDRQTGGFDDGYHDTFRFVKMVLSGVSGLPGELRFP
jgi:hypothetical protein